MAAQTGVPPAGRVVDLANALSATTEAALEADLVAHQDSTSNEVAVLTLPSLEGEPLERYATRVARAWGLGREGRDNGVLVLVVLDDRAVRIEVGGGLEGALTDATAGSIIRAEMVPRFREGNVDGGVLAGVGAVLGAVEGEYRPPADGRSWLARQVLSWSTWSRIEVVSISAFLAIFFPIVARGKVDGMGVTESLSGDVLDAAGLGFFAGVPAAVALYVWFVTGWAVVWGLLGFPLACVAIELVFEVHPTLGPKRRANRERIRASRAKHAARQRAYREARERGETQVEIDGEMVNVPPAPPPGGYRSASYSTSTRRRRGGGWFDGGWGGGSRSSGGGFGGGWFGGGGASDVW